MEGVKDRFHRELGDLKQLIDFFNIENEISKHKVGRKITNNAKMVKKLKDSLDSFKIRKRQFNYNSIIISLYGFFEKFIEDSIVSYLDHLSLIITDYTKLPPSLSKSHFDLSLSLLSKIESAKYKDYIKKEDIVSNLNTCLNSNGSYILNNDAFIIHAANYKSAIINTAFSNAGIESFEHKILKQADFRNYVIQTYKKNKDDDIKAEESFYLLNDLAQLRNDVAHGVSNQIKANDLLLDYVYFFEFYAQALSDVLTFELLKYECQINAVELGEMTSHFKDGKIICFYSMNIPFKVGDTLISYGEVGSKRAQIESIQLAETDVNEIDENDNYEVGVCLSSNFKKKSKLFLLKI